MCVLNKFVLVRQYMCFGPKSVHVAMRGVWASLFEMCYGVQETIRHEQEETPMKPHASENDVEDIFFKFGEEHV